MTTELIIDVDLDYGLEGPSDLLLQIEAAALTEQEILDERITLPPTDHLGRIPGEDGIGTRAWMRTAAPFVVNYRARVRIDRPAARIEDLPAPAPHLLGPQATRYLMASRFCPSDRFIGFAASEFGDTLGGARVAAIRDWVADSIAYVPGASGPQTTAEDTYIDRQGICRDFAHLTATLCRASGIPARVAAVYGPDVVPPDFHAVAEVWLDGAWHMVDPTGMGAADALAIIGVGADAAEVAFLTSYGIAHLNSQEVRVRVA